MQLLADHLVELEVVSWISDETVRRRLKKTTSSPSWREQRPKRFGRFAAGNANRGASPRERPSSCGAWRMEDVLDLYAQPYDEVRPVVCSDEKPYQLLANITPDLSAQPGQARRQDDEYTR